MEKLVNKNYFQELKIIKELYQKIYTKRILMTAPSGLICPYFYDWLKIFTPLEYLVWHDIRLIGLPFYPQYPIKNYFVDFADPIKKIVIEVDGNKWHKGREREDLIRQGRIENLGWKFIRFTGQEVYKKIKLLKFEKLEEIEDRKNFHWPEEDFELSEERWWNGEEGVDFLYYSEFILHKLKTNHYDTR